MSILGSLLYALDTPGAYTRGALGGKLGQRLSGEEMLSQWGAPSNAATGFLAEMLADPLNLIPGGLLLKGGKAALAGVKANKASKLLRALGHMPEEVAKLTKLRSPARPANPFTVSEVFGMDPLRRGKFLEEQLGIDLKVPEVLGEDLLSVWADYSPRLNEALPLWKKANPTLVPVWEDYSRRLNEAFGLWKKSNPTPSAATAEGPLRVSHGTAGPLFEEFGEDVGTGNWMGKGVYFSDPKDASKYAEGRVSPPPNKILSPEELADFKRRANVEREYLEGGLTEEDWKSFLANEDGIDELLPASLDNWPPPPEPPRPPREPLGLAPRVMNRFIDTRKPLDLDAPLETALLRAIRKATKGKGVMPENVIKDVKAVKRTQAGIDAMKVPGNVRSEKGLSRLIQKQKLKNADAYLMALSRVRPDDLTDALKGQGYDALIHGKETHYRANPVESALWDRYGYHDNDLAEYLHGKPSRVPGTVQELAEFTPRIDAHPEYVAFSPEQVYAPFVAPALQRTNQYQSPLAALLGYNAGMGGLRSRE